VLSSYFLSIISCMLSCNALLRRLVTRVFCRDLLQAVTRSYRKLWTLILSPILWMHNEYNRAMTRLGNRTLRTWDISALRHFGTVQVGPKCPDISAQAPKCPRQFGPRCWTVQPHGPNCPTISTNVSYPTLWSEMSHPNFVVYVACSPTSFSPENAVCYYLLNRNLQQLIGEYDYFKEDSFASCRLARSD